MNKEQFGKSVAQCRKKLNIAQAQLADTLHVTATINIFVFVILTSLFAAADGLSSIGQRIVTTSSVVRKFRNHGFRVALL